MKTNRVFLTDRDQTIYTQVPESELQKVSKKSERGFEMTEEAFRKLAESTKIPASTLVSE